jgi:hypothetical protein
MAREISIPIEPKPLPPTRPDPYTPGRRKQNHVSIVRHSHWFAMYSFSHLLILYTFCYIFIHCLFYALFTSIVIFIHWFSVYSFSHLLILYRFLLHFYTLFILCKFLLSHLLHAFSHILPFLWLTHIHFLCMHFLIFLIFSFIMNTQCKNIDVNS